MKPANQLEQRLMEAAHDPERLHDFYNTLMDSKVLFVGAKGTEGEVSPDDPNKHRVRVQGLKQEDGAVLVPFFTSAAELELAMGNDAEVLSVPARNFFEMTQGIDVVLNPASTYCKPFTQSEVQGLLNPESEPLMESGIINNNADMLLQQPTYYPVEMMSALAEFFTEQPAVKAAYLCEGSFPTTAAAPSVFIIGIEGERSLMAVLNKAQSIIEDTRPKNQMAEAILLQGQETDLHHYLLNSIKPFYKQASKKGFWSWLGFG